jgi:hypothetical protein
LEAVQWKGWPFSQESACKPIDLAVFMHDGRQLLLVLSTGRLEDACPGMEMMMLLHDEILGIRLECSASSGDVSAYCTWESTRSNSCPGSADDGVMLRSRYKYRLEQRQPFRGQPIGAAQSVCLFLADDDSDMREMT